jgi:protein TonB
MAMHALPGSFAPPPTRGAMDDFIVPPAAPWRRFAATGPLAVLTLVAMLLGSRFIKSSLSAPPHYDQVMATLVEPSPPPLPARLQGGAAPVTKRAAKPIHRERRSHPQKPELPPPALATSPSGGIAVPVAPARSGAAKEDTAGIRGGAGVGSGSGVGTDNAGARAIYAPPPKIPDDLRQDALQAEALAHFVVAPDGTLTVTLVKPTGNPRLNQMLLSALSQWQFFPAMRSGVPVASEFDLRIPIVVE